MLNAYARVNKGKLISVHTDDKKDSSYSSTFGNVIEKTYQEFLKKNAIKNSNSNNTKEKKILKRRKKMNINRDINHNVSDCGDRNSHCNDKNGNTINNDKYNNTNNKSNDTQKNNPSFHVKIEGVRLSTILVDAVLSSLKSGKVLV